MLNVCIPPSELEAIREAMSGSMRDTLDELEPLPERFVEAVQRGRDHVGSDSLVCTIRLTFRFSREQLISDTIASLKDHPAWSQ